MPYSFPQLRELYTNIMVGLAPTPAAEHLLRSYAKQNARGTLTDAQTLKAVFALSPATRPAQQPADG